MTAVDIAAVRAELAAAVEVLGEPGLDTYLARGTALDDAAVTRIELADDVATEVRTETLQLLGRLVDRELLPYDPSYQPSPAQALVSPLTDVPALHRLHEWVLSDDVPIDPSDGTPVHAMAHRLHHGETAVVAYRVKGAGIATRRPKGLRALLPRDGVYVRADEEILYYEPRVDAWVCGDYVFVTTRTTLERRLHAPEQAQAMAREMFEKATALVAIQGADELAAAVASDPTMRDKMASLVRSIDADPDFAAHLTTARLVDFAEQHPTYGVRIEGTGDDRQLVYEPSPQTRYRIVKLLADDLLRSELTQRLYEAGSKQRIADG